MSLSHDLESLRHILKSDIFSTSKLFSGLLKLGCESNMYSEDGWERMTNLSCY